jgi:hypothetical protein
MKDFEGRFLIPFRQQDTLRNKPVWAVYKIAHDGFEAACQTDVSNIAAARIKADTYNADRPDGYYFKVFRRATASEIDPTINKPSWWK